MISGSRTSPVDSGHKQMLNSPAPRKNLIRRVKPGEGSPCKLFKSCSPVLWASLGERGQPNRPRRAGRRGFTELRAPGPSKGGGLGPVTLLNASELYMSKTYTSTIFCYLYFTTIF